MRVTAHAVRSGDWWAIDIPEVPGVFTQVKRLDQVAEQVADAIATLTGADPATVDVDLKYETSHQADVARLAELEARLERDEREAYTLRRRIVRELRDEGLSVRDVGTIVDISPQRVSQLVG